MTDDPSPDTFVINVPEPYLTTIGKVTVVWGVLESVVDLSIWRLAGFKQTDHRSAIVTAHMTWPLKMDVIEALAVAVTPDHPQFGAFGSVRPLLKKAQEGRNRIAHGQWGYVDGKVIKARATARGRLRAQIIPITLDEIEAIVADIALAGRALLKLVFDA
jgi:hypothetical protein